MQIQHNQVLHVRYGVVVFRYPISVLIWRIFDSSGNLDYRTGIGELLLIQQQHLFNDICLWSSV